MDGAALADRLLSSALGVIDLVTIAIGHRLDLYRTLHEHGPLTSEELVAHAGVDPRYVQEWLEQQAVAGLLTYADGRFALPAEHVPVLLDPDSLSYLAPLADLMSAAAPRSIRSSRRSAPAVASHGRATARACASAKRPATGRGSSGPS